MKKLAFILITTLMTIWGVFIAYQYLSYQIDPLQQGFLENIIWGETYQESKLFNNNPQEWVNSINTKKLPIINAFYKQKLNIVVQKFKTKTGRDITEYELSSLPERVKLNQVKELQELLSNFKIENSNIDSSKINSLRFLVRDSVKIYQKEQLEKRFNGYKDALSTIFYFTLTLIISYILYISVLYFGFDKTKIKVNITPFLFFGFFFMIIYIGYNYNFFVNVMMSKTDFTKITTNLTQAQTTNVLHDVFIISDFWLIQWSFISKMFLILLVNLGLIFTAVITGAGILKRLSFNLNSLFSNFLFSVAIGLGIIIFSLFLLGVLHIMNWYVVILLMIIYLGIFYKETCFWFKKFFTHKITFEANFFSYIPIAILFISVFLSIDVIALLRPVPTGWDAINTYQNTTQLIGNYGYLISGVNYFNWEIVMSLGHVFFGGTEYGTLIALFLSFLGLILTLFVLYYFISKLINKSAGWLACVLYISLPMVQHFSSADMKIDNALFFFSILAVLAFFKWKKLLSVQNKDTTLSSKLDQGEKPAENSLWLPIFGISGALLFYFFVQWNVPIPFSFLPDLTNTSFSGLIISGTFLVILVLFSLMGVLLIKNIRREADLFSHNRSSDDVFKGSLKEYIFNQKWLFICGILLGIAMGIKLSTVFVVFPLLVFTAYTFWGWLGVSCFASFLLWGYSLSNQALYLNTFTSDTSIHVYIRTILLIIAGVSFILLIIIHRKQIIQKAVVMLILLLMLSLPMIPWLIKHSIEFYPNISMGALIKGKNANTPVFDINSLNLSEKCTHSAYKEEIGRYMGKTDSGMMKYLKFPWTMTMNTTEVKGMYVNISFYLLAIVPFILFYLFYLWRKKAYWYLFVFTVIYFALWTFSAGQGIIWYALCGFLGLLFFVCWLVYGEKKHPARKFILLILITCSIIASLAIRLERWKSSKTLFGYGYGKYTTDNMIEKMLPDYTRIRNLLESTRIKDPDRYYLYRIGTFITFFVKDSDQIIVKNDNQLDTMTCISQGDDHAVMAERLKKLGVRYVMLDLYTATIEKDLQGSLHQKFRKFLEFANDNKYVKIHYPKVPAKIKQKYSYLPTDIPMIDVNSVEKGVIVTFKDQSTGQQIPIRHQGFVFLEIL